MIFSVLTQIDAFFWSYVGFSLIMGLGCYFTFMTRAFQIRAAGQVFNTFFGFIRHRDPSAKGTHPLKVFFASVGGMVGVGNVVGIVTALQIGGPGALFWVWVAAFLGSLIKYSEVYLGLKYRVPNERGGFDGGSIYFLQKAFKARWISTLACVLLCVYGAEVYQFSVLSHTISINWHINHVVVVFALLAVVFYAILGGIGRVGKICGTIMPFFIVAYLGMGLWVVGHHVMDLPMMLIDVFKSAFTGHAAVGGFAGSSLLLALQHGISRSVYSADIGIGYDSIIHSETSADKIVRQAHLAIFGVFLDNTICTFTLLVALASGLWKTVPMMDSSLVVQTAFSEYLPYQEIFMPIFFFVLVYTTLISYLFVGLKCARQLNHKYGERLYLVFAAVFLVSFSFLDQSRALLIMSLAGCLLLCINLLGIFRLRHEIPFYAPKQKKPTLQKA